MNPYESGNRASRSFEEQVCFPRVAAWMAALAHVPPLLSIAAVRDGLDTHMSVFGDHLRKARKQKLASDRSFSVRQLAGRIGVEPSYLSKVERGQQPPPSEKTILALAAELGEYPNVLLALAGKVSAELKSVILHRTKLYADLIGELKKDARSCGAANRSRSP